MKNTFFLFVMMLCSGNLAAQNTDQIYDVTSGRNSEFISSYSPPNQIDRDGMLFLRYQDASRLSLMHNGESTPKLTREFTIQMPEGGTYYLSANVMGTYDAQSYLAGKKNANSFQEIHVYINDTYQGELEITKGEWLLTTIKGIPAITLLAGPNRIRFESEAPYYPEVDAIRIVNTRQAIYAVDEEYTAYLNYLKSPKETDPGKIEQSELDEYLKLTDIPLPSSAIDPGNSSWQVTPQKFDNPRGQYAHLMNVPLTYTYHRKLSLPAGTYTFHTAAIAGEPTVDPVMYLYKTDDPHTYSYMNDDESSGNRHPKITATLPAGEYYLIVRAYNSSFASSTTGRQGLVDVYQNNTKLNTNAPVAGYMVDVKDSKTGLLNYFTAYSKGIPEFYLIDNTNKAKFFGSTYFYLSDMDFMWFDDARMRLDKKSGSSTYSMLITAGGAMGAYYGNCDVYANIPSGSNSNFGGAFPNLKAGDCMLTAPNSNDYNCASWAGGRVDLGRYFWASSGPSSDNLSSPWYVAGNEWASWDNFFGNTPKRFATAPSYSRTSSGPQSQAEIALWTGNHASVKMAGNNMPHGYSWESKCGGYGRMFHPESAFQGSSYGSIRQLYYRNVGASSHTLSSDEDLNWGLTIYPKIELTDDEKSFVNEMNLVKIRTLSEDQYALKLNAFLDKINSPAYMHISDPQIIFNLEEYQALLAYCRENKGEIFYKLILDAFSENNLTSEIVSGLLVELTHADYPGLLNQVKENWANHSYTDAGEYIAPSPEANKKNFIKQIINKQKGVSTKATRYLLQETVNNDQVFQVTPNPATSSTKAKFTLAEDAVVYLTVCSMHGSFATPLLNGKYFKAGAYEIPLNISNLPKGVYICTLISGQQKMSRRFLIE